MSMAGFFVAMSPQSIQVEESGPAAGESLGRGLEFAPAADGHLQKDSSVEESFDDRVLRRATCPKRKIRQKKEKMCHRPLIIAQLVSFPQRPHER